VCPDEFHAEAAAELCYKATEVQFDAGSPLFEVGTPCRFCFLVVSGDIGSFFKAKLKIIYDSGAPR